MTDQLFLTVSDIQQQLGIGRNSAYDLVKRSDFPKIKIGNRILIPYKQFEQWIDAETSKGSGVINGANEAK